VVSRHHVVNHTGLGDLLRAELRLSVEVQTVVVAEVVVGGDESGLRKTE
jgi:hypothetical protein